MPVGRLLKDRAGTTGLLEQVGADKGFGVQVIPQFTVDGLVASSTKIRDFALLGVLDGVRKLLGRDHDVDGEIIINLAPPETAGNAGESRAPIVGEFVDVSLTGVDGYDLTAETAASPRSLREEP